MENSRKYTPIVIVFFLFFACASKTPQSAYQTKDGQNKQKYYNAVYLGNKNDQKKYGKKINKKKK